mgnify:CR=1 FL=1
MATKMGMADLQLVDREGEDTQRVAVLDAPYRLSVRNALIPEPKADEVRVKILWVGICGSDLEAYRGTRAPEFLSIPARLGHEVSGIIDKVGDKVIGLKAGDKVTCRYVWGAYAQYIVCKPFHVKVLPPDFPMLEISPIEVLPGILHAAELGKIDQTKNVLIMGQGVSGLIMTQVVKLFSPKNLAVTDLSPRPRNMALPTFTACPIRTRAPWNSSGGIFRMASMWSFPACWRAMAWWTRSIAARCARAWCCMDALAYAANPSISLRRTANAWNFISRSRAGTSICGVFSRKASNW